MRHNRGMSIELIASDKASLCNIRYRDLATLCVLASLGEPQADEQPSLASRLQSVLSDMEAQYKGRGRVTLDLPDTRELQVRVSAALNPSQTAEQQPSYVIDGSLGKAMEHLSADRLKFLAGALGATADLLQPTRPDRV